MPFWPVMVSAPPRPLTVSSSTAVLLTGCEVGVKTPTAAGAVRAMPMLSSALVPE